MGREYTDEHGRKIYETDAGAKLILTTVSPLFLKKLQSAGTLPDIPTRKVKLDLDGFEPTYQEEPLAEDDLQDADEERRWKAYVAARDAVLEKRQDRFMKAIFDKGTELIGGIQDVQAWKEDLEYYDLPVPTNPRDIKVEYLQSEIIKTAEDMVGVITGVLAQSGVPEEEVENMRAMFRGSIRRRSTAQTENADGEVELVRDLYPDESGALLEGVASE